MEEERKEERKIDALNTSLVSGFRMARFSGVPSAGRQ